MEFNQSSVAAAYSQGLRVIKTELADRLESAGATIGFGSVRHPAWPPGEDPPKSILIDAAPFNGPSLGLFFDADEILASAIELSPEASEKIDRYVTAFLGPGGRHNENAAGCNGTTGRIRPM